ncbi:MAG TPA: hypothetical protein VI548_13770 [Chitinophagaceae bacterium]|nr:hypothetical protein [Chitinophagaceae bacterium]
MSQQILQLNFKFNVYRKVYKDTVSPLAKDFAKVTCCQWKICLMNEKDKDKVEF